MENEMETTLACTCYIYICRGIWGCLGIGGSHCKPRSVVKLRTSKQPLPAGRVHAEGEQKLPSYEGDLTLT